MRQSEHTANTDLANTNRERPRDPRALLDERKPLDERPRVVQSTMPAQGNPNDPSTWALV